MKKILTLAAAALLCASIASAQGGINLYAFPGTTGGACTASGLGATLTSTCSTIGTAFRLMATVEVPRSLVQLAACGQTIDVKTNSATLPDWWKLDTCRLGKTISTMNGTVAGSCAATIWDFGSSPLVVEGYTQDANGPATLRMQMGGAVGAPFDVNIADAGGIELGLSILQIQNGPSTCTGCGIAACMVLKEVTLNEDGTANFPHVTNALASNYATWLGNGPAAPANYCPAATPTTNRTWGALKSLYR